MSPTKKKAPAHQPPGRQLRRKMMASSAPALAAAPAAAPAPDDDPRIAAIRAAQEGAEIVLAQLLHLSDEASTASEMAEIQPDIELARATINDCAQKEIDLTASLTTIAPPDAATVAKLQSLAASIDAATIKSAILNATLAGLADVLNSAIRINAML
jgi:hypothetical protein